MLLCSRLVVPLSTKLKNVAGYVPLTLKCKQISFHIHSDEMTSQSKVLPRKGKISDKRLKEVKTEIKSGGFMMKILAI